MQGLVVTVIVSEYISSPNEDCGFWALFLSVLSLFSGSPHCQFGLKTKKLSLNIQVNRPPHYVTYGDVIYYLCMWFDYVTKLVLELFPERAQWLRGVLLSSWGCQTTSRHLRNSLHLAMKYLPQVSLSIKPKAVIFYVSICVLTKNTFNAQYARISNLLNSLSKQRGGSVSDFNTNCYQLYLLLAS